MSHTGRGLLFRRPARRLAAGMATLLLLGGATGIAWAIGVDKGKSYQSAGTYYISDPAADTAEDPGQTVNWPKVGRVSLGSECFAYRVAGSAQIHVGMKALTVTNNGPSPVGVAADSGFVWLAPGDQEAFFRVGEAVNEAVPEGGGGVHTLAILDEGGTSATGTFAWSARAKPADDTGRCVVSLQLRG